MHPLDKLCDELSITHKLIRPRTPRHNGKVERSHRTDNERFYRHLKFYSYEDLKYQMKQYLKKTNNIPMATLNYLTPQTKKDKKLKNLILQIKLIKILSHIIYKYINFNILFLIVLFLLYYKYNLTLGSTFNIKNLIYFHIGNHAYIRTCVCANNSIN